MGCCLWSSSRKNPGQAQAQQQEDNYQHGCNAADSAQSALLPTGDLGGASFPDHTHTRLQDAGIASLSQPDCEPTRHSDAHTPLLPPPTPTKQPPQASLPPPMPPPALGSSPSGTSEVPMTQMRPESSSQPEIRNLGPREPLSTLVDDFKYNVDFCKKVAELESIGYSGWRRIRGDGNCFYRCIAFGLLEELATAKLEDRIRWSIALSRQFAPLTFDGPVEAAAHRGLLDRLRNVASGGTWQDAACGGSQSTEIGDIEGSFLDQSPECVDLAFVRALRCCLANYLIEHRDDEDAACGISFEIICIAQDFAGIEEFCAKVVLPIGEEAEGIALQALPSAIGVSLRIAYIDRLRASMSEPVFVNYGPSDADAPHLCVQLRPGHYDLLYGC
eukprot:NODE_7673_length_1558_cov_8.950384.p1 GENE.NODE_7673_length_1558_cov_8.950384~~NODE_7673_length_1558_cov_8.950384.p1  ORF type:complete len:388 (+),score=68.75 NODE_7673_length_1558_cov_8.950384:91-1254(+)